MTGDRLDEIVRAATSIGDVVSAAIFTVPPGSTTLELAAAAGINGPALDALVAAVRDPAHPVARASSDDDPSFDVPPIAQGGPRLRSHLPLVARGRAVGVLAVAHDSPLDRAQRDGLLELATAAATAIAGD